MAKQLFVGANHSALYAKFRPSPPPALIKEIITYLNKEILEDLDKAVDVGCGTGQSTLALQPYFKDIKGFDVSESQLVEAMEHARDIPNITFGVSQAETLPIADNSVHLVTSSQAMHWFDLPSFYEEVYRILVPNGVLGAYGYVVVPQLVSDNPEEMKRVQLVIDQFYTITLKQFWDYKLRLVENMYQEIQFPDQLFTDVVRVESIIDRNTISFSNFVGYLTTWSAFQQLKKQDPNQANRELMHVVQSIIDIVGNRNQEIDEIQFTIETSYFLLMGRKKRITL